MVEVNRQERMTLPAKARRALGIEGESQVELELAEDAVRLRPAVVIPREDARAYTAEHMALTRRALGEVEGGKLIERSNQDIDDLAQQ